MAGTGIDKIFSPSEVWQHYRSHQSEYHNLLVLIAKYPNYGIYIYATCEVGQFKVEVHADDVMVYEEEIYHEADCNKTISRIYDEYLNDNATSWLAEFQDDDDEDESCSEDEEIEMREDEIECLFTDLFVGLLGSVEFGNLDEKVIEDIREHTLEYMARKHNIDLYRPMYLEDENGEDFYEEHPYSHMVFEDEDNPIYK